MTGPAPHGTPEALREFIAVEHPEHGLHPCEPRR